MMQNAPTGRRRWRKAGCWPLKEGGRGRTGLAGVSRAVPAGPAGVAGVRSCSGASLPRLGRLRAPSGEGTGRSAGQEARRRGWVCCPRTGSMREEGLRARSQLFF